MQHEPVVVEKTYNAPIEKVWNAISDKTEMKKWYFDVPEFKPEVGNEFTFVGQGKDGKGNFIHLCKVTEVIPHKKLAYTWRYENYPGDSLVTFELFPEGKTGKQTRVKLTHTGLETFPQTFDLQRQNFVEGWTVIINSFLLNYLEPDAE